MCLHKICKSCRREGESKGVGRKVQVYTPSFMRVHSSLHACTLLALCVYKNMFLAFIAKQ